MSGSPKFELQLRENDALILYVIQSTFGFGKVQHRSNARRRVKGSRARDYYGYTVSGRYNACVLVDILEEGFYGNDADWLACFCDGEACFTITRCGSPEFTLKLREDDMQVLLDIQSMLGVGSVKHHSLQPSRNKGMLGANDAVRLRVYGSNCLKVVDTLEGKLRTKKARDFKIWSKAVRTSVALGTGQHPDRKPMMLQYKRQLEEARKFVPFVVGSKDV